MAASLITKAPSATTANTPPLVRDPMIRAGSKVTFDLTDARCHPGGVITPGVPVVGTIFTSLDAVPVQAIVQAGGVVTVNADGSLTLAGGSLNDSGLRIGIDRQFDMSAGEYERLMYLWAKLPVDGYTTTDFATMMAITPTNNNKTQGTFDTGTGGLRPRFSIANTAGTLHTAAGPAVDVTRGVVHQFAGRFDPSARIEYFSDGALRAGVDSTQADVYPPVSGEPMYLRVPNRIAMTVYRFGLLDIDASIAAETGYGYAAADILTSYQHVAADWQFGTGVLPGAPKTAFA